MTFSIYSHWDGKLNFRSDSLIHVIFFVQAFVTGVFTDFLLMFPADLVMDQTLFCYLLFLFFSPPIVSTLSTIYQNQS